MSIEAMKQALEALEEIADEVFSPYDNKIGESILLLRKAIAETSVATNDTSQDRVDETAKQRHEQEPVAWIDAASFAKMSQDPRFNRVQWQTTLTLSKVYEGQIAFYTSPPQRQPLTDEQLDALRQDARGLNFVTLREFRVIARAIEAAHGIGD